MTDMNPWSPEATQIRPVFLTLLEEAQRSLERRRDPESLAIRHRCRRAIVRAYKRKKKISVLSIEVDHRAKPPPGYNDGPYSSTR